ncbi:MAG TPA: hypothetical protein VFZ51_00810 [Woeseiaceae bacterium]
MADVAGDRKAGFGTAKIEDLELVRRGWLGTGCLMSAPRTQIAIATGYLTKW